MIPPPATQFARTELLIGREGLDRLRNARVTVVGLGAVGSYAVEGLARAGIGHLQLVDFDDIQHSNLNRQLYALHSTIGRPKVDLAAARVRDINPECHVDARSIFVRNSTVADAIGDHPDAVVDAIDSLGCKVALLEAAVRADVPLIVSSMGAALRTDPTAVRIAPLHRTRHCPLAKKVRKWLGKRGIRNGITCVYSEEPVCDRDHARGEAVREERPDGHPAAGGRPRQPLGSLPTLTGIFGLALANHVITTIAAPPADSAAP